jgi:phosphocarrier protein HPr
MSACRESVLIINQRGLHASELPATCTVAVHKDGVEAAGGSILGLMMLGAAKGDTIEIVVSGEGAQDALEKLAALVKDGFGEN